uniref:Tetratricopeptide repeat protein n=1 Tax=candidate division WOR-3 bacterium TaxID=2052148 RepID=A0A7C4CDJ3_UNCW3
MARLQQRTGTRSGRKSETQSIWMWIVGGVVVAAMLFMVVRTMSSAPAPSPPLQRVDPAKTDLSAYTRMVGEPAIDTLLRFSASETCAAELRQIETMIQNRELRDAVARMQRMLARTSRPALERALLHGYIAVCEYELANPNAALVNLLGGLGQITVADSATAELQAWLGFQVGWLFQYYGRADSAREYYSLALQSAPPASRLRPGLLNNLGAALESTGDTTGAAETYLAAAAIVDTTGQGRESARVRNNLRRLAPRLKATRP